MIALYSLLFCPRLRSFALIDRHGICRALRQASRLPTGGDWVEVEGCLPTWLNQPLPASARLRQESSASRTKRRLAHS